MGYDEVYRLKSIRGTMKIIHRELHKTGRYMKEEERPAMSEFRVAGAVLILLLLGGCGASRPRTPNHMRSTPGEPTAIRLEDLVQPAKIMVPEGPTENQAYTERRGFPEYVMGPGDLLQITNRTSTEIEAQEVTVESNGMISYLFLDDIYASGLTPGELDSVITERLSMFIRRPRVDVLVTEHNAKKVSLLGAIDRGAGSRITQGRFGLEGRTTALDLILEQGGPDVASKMDRVRLTRGGHAYTLNLQRALYGGDLSDNVVLEAGDILFIPGGPGQIRKKALILGEISAPGIYEFDEDVTVLEAVLRSGGFTSNAVQQDMKVVRGDPRDPVMLTVNVDGILHQADIAQNIVLEDNDIVYVPRDFLGSLNEVMSRLDPVLSFLMWPGTYRTIYTTGGGLRLDTGMPPTGAPSITQFLPSPGAGTASTSSITPSAKPVDEQEDE